MKVFCWDLNGTLEEGGDIALTESINDILRDRRIRRVVTTKDIHNLLGGDVDKLVEQVTGITVSREEIEELTFAKVEKYVKPVEGAEEVLSEVRRRGDMNVVISGSGTRMVVRYLEVAGLMPYVNAIAGIDTIRMAYAQMGVDIELGDVINEKSRVLLRFANHDYIDRAIVVGDSYNDMKAAFITNAMLHENGKRRNVRPILFRPHGRKERVRLGLKQRINDRLAHMSLYNRAKTLREAMEMGYEREYIGHLRKHPYSTGIIAIGCLTAGISAGFYFLTGNSYWYSPFLALPIVIPPSYFLPRKMENQYTIFREESI